MILHENRLPAWQTILMKYHTLLVIFEKAAKFEIIGGALRYTWVVHINAS